MKERTRPAERKRKAGPPRAESQAPGLRTLTALRIVSSACLLLALWAPATANSFWGLNLWGLWPVPLRLGVSLLALGWIWVFASAIGRISIPRIPLRPVFIVVGVCVLLTLFWTQFGSQTLLFGDAMEVANRIGSASAVTPRSPLYSFLVHAMGRAAGARHPELLGQAIQGISIVSGLVAFLLLYRVWTRRYRGMGLLWIGIVLGGYVGLFQGYVEAYALIVTAICAYMVLLLSPRGTGRTIALLVTQAGAIAAHTLGILLGPITFWSILEPFPRRARMIAAVISGLLVAVLVLVRSTGDSMFLHWIPPLSFFTRQLGYLMHPPLWSPGIFSVWHLVDIANTYFLGLGAGTALALYLLLTPEGRRAFWKTCRSPIGWVAALFFVARCFIVTPLGGPVLDWDLFVVFAIPWAFFIAEAWRQAALTRVNAAAGRVLAAAALVFVLPLVTMLHSSDAATQRVVSYGIGTPRPRDYVQAQIAHHLGDQATRAGDNVGAARLFSLAYRLDPNPVYARRAGVTWLRVGNNDEALRELSYALDADSLDAVSLKERAFIWLGRRNADLAEKDFQALSRAIPGDATSVMGLGLVAQQRGDVEAMERYMKEFVRLAEEQLGKGAGDYSSLHSDLGTAFMTLNRPQEAAREFEATLSINSDRPSTWMSLGKCYLSLSRFTEARRAFERAHQLAPDWSSVLKSLAQVCELEGDTQAAIDAYTKALALQEDSGSRISRGKLFMTLGRMNEAREDATRALALDPQSLEAEALLSSLSPSVH